MRRQKHPLTVCLRQPPLPLPGGEELKACRGGDFYGWRFLSPGKGERWIGEAETVRGCIAPHRTEAHP
jgi:hypothetical protein